MKKKYRKKTYKGVLAALLASVVLLTSSQWLQVEAKENPGTQTGYDNLIEYQVERWNTILDAVFGNTVSKTSVSGTTANVTIPSAANIENKSAAVVREGNDYFNWDSTKTADLPDWSGGSGTITLDQIASRKETVVYAEENVGTTTAPETKIEYTVYDVRNADELYCVMSAVKDVDYNVKINLCADIDLNGENRIWYSKDVDPVCNKKNYWYYIEGNGHTIYNMKTRSTGDKTASFLGYLENDDGSYTSKKVVLKNLNFSNCLVISSNAQSAVVIGMNEGRLYMENVNVTDSFLHSSGANVGGILGRNECTTGCMFMRNCSTSNLYAFGTDHVGGFSGTFYNNRMGSSFPVRYDAAFPVSPESWMATKGKVTMPLMVENCYSVDSELFSVGTSGDSGAFISCGAKFICRNSFTNNIIYGSTNTGAFIGRIVTEAASERGMLDDKGNGTVATYFDNCYASGSVEGRDKIGGFVGYDCAGNNSSYGITVYKNCYTTAMAGMDYAGRQVGGFIGHENTREGQKASIATGTGSYTTNSGAVYINCYAAGEVGNILTETNADYVCQESEADAQGGFLGAVGYWGFHYNPNAQDQFTEALEGESNGNYINCYYDMQTTGMRERASGKSWSFADQGAGASQIPGVTGVYTQYSDAKEVMGLVYSRSNQSMCVSMRDGVWMYRDGYYPALSSFSGPEAQTNFGTLRQSGTIISREEIAVASEEEETATEEETLSETAESQERESETVPHQDSTEDTAHTVDTEETESLETSPGIESTEVIENIESTEVTEGLETAAGPETIESPETIPGTESTEGVESIESTEMTESTEPAENTEASESVESPEDSTEPSTEEESETEEEIEALDVGDGTVYPTYDDAALERIQNKLNEKAAMVPNYLEASVSTVFLNHWDSAMNMDTGTLGGENDWAVGLPANRLTQKEYNPDDPNLWAQDTDGKYWEMTYKNLAAGSYELKVQAGDSWTYNFGSDKFNGNNCVLQVPEDCDVKVKFDYVAPASITVENTAYRIWAEFYSDLYDAEGNEIEDARPFDIQVLGYNTMEDMKSTWTVVGSLPGSDWDRTNTNFDMNYMGTGQGNGDYELVMTLPAGSYSFQITRDHRWDECYGLSGNNGRDENMTFVLSKQCEVSILFNENTHLTTIETNPADALTASQTRETEADFEGYSLISSEAITGHNWLDGLDAALAGKMTDDDGDGVYKASFNVTGKDNFNKLHGYKVITDGKNIGNKSYFHLDGPALNAPDEEYNVELTFCYNPETGETWVEDNKGDNSWVDNDLKEESWNVLGSEKLTGFSWDEGMTEEEKEGMTRGKMDLDDDKTTYYINYENVAPGTHSFKVVADGSFDSGIEYGDFDGNNYQFTTTREATITIAFNSKTKEISVATVPDDVVTYADYVVSGTASLTGSNWDASDEENRMGYMGGYLDTYMKEYEVVTGGQYAFKVVHFGTDDKVTPIGIQVEGEEGTTYTLRIIYHERNSLTEYRLYDKDGRDVTDYLFDIRYESWSVLGEKGLTGYNWEDAANGNQAAAAAAGQMEWDKNDGLYVKTFPDVAVSATPQILNFKVVAGGSWDTGVSYGDRLGNNYTIVLASNEVTSCSVTIIFDPVTHKISVSANPDCLVDGAIDESGLVWYIAGDYDLVSEDAYYTAATVYDTVRDITSAFTFTSGSHVGWTYDDSRNNASGFFSRIGTTPEGTGFDLDYKVEDKEISGTFNERVITLKYDEEVGAYVCSRFMPGKQWVKVTTGVGSRSIRLVPTAYLEAGNDADIYVLQSKSDTKLEHVGNTVVYQENDLAGEVTFNGLEGTTFNRYNVALTAAYAITDRTGFGYYGNYSQQKVVKYDEEMIRSNELHPDKTTDYFTMSSVFGKSASYDDKVIKEGETSNLIIDELVDQNLIGSSYGTDDSLTKAKTIIKVARLDKDGGTTKVFTTRNISDGAEADRAKSVYEKNYLKWTGQMPFDSADAGTYEVTYYWSLSDGRYLTDSKKVTVYSGLASIEKKVEPNWFELINAQDGKTQTISYTVTYNNPVKGDFSIVDVLPFDGDIRKDTSRRDGTNSSSVGAKLTLKDVTVEKGGVLVDITKTSYTTDIGVQKYVKKENNEFTEYFTEEMLDTGSADQIVKDTNIGWSDVSGLGNGASATAIRIDGTQRENGTGVITLKYTIEASDAQRGDYYVNNAFFTVDRTDVTEAGEITVNGVSNPVLTAAVGRELSGYVWLDSDQDGRYDANEPAIGGVTVILQKYDPGTSEWSNVNSSVSSEDGYYEFVNIYPDGEYQVVFKAPDNGKVTLYKANETPLEADFAKLLLTRRLSRYQVTDKNLSRNIADQSGDSYYIDEYLPTIQEIYSNNTQPYYKEGSVTDYYFTRQYQNLGLTDAKPKASSLTIRKREGTLNGKKLPGVKFKLEYSLDASDNYQPVLYYVNDKNEYVFVDPKDRDKLESEGKTILTKGEAMTDENGQFRFTGLPAADYRLTEVEALEGYNPLGAPVEFILPYVEGIEDENEYITDKNNPEKSELDEGVVRYYDITYTITNSKPLNMPMTGHWRELLPLILAGILFAGAVGIYAGYRIKKRKA